MRRTCIALLLASAALCAHAVTVTTLITTPLAIEGLTNDDQGNLYTPGRATTAGQACPVWRIPVDNPSLTVVGLVPAPSATGTCSPSGLAFGPDGKLYVTQTDRIYRFTPNAATPPTAELWASNVPGTNGLAFDQRGFVWTGDGTTGLGRVWRIAPNGTPTEMFRVPGMTNDVPVAGSIGVGRDVRSIPPAAIAVTATSRNASNTLGSQPLVANGIMVTRRGNLIIADTARGALWAVFLDHDGNVQSPLGCDTTYAANTLCMDNVLVQHPFMEGADGITLDAAGGVWVDANERNAVVYVTPYYYEPIEVYRNPPDATTKLRNKGPLETPTSPVLVGHKFCTANSDGNRRDNSPNTEGEIGGTGQDRGKISCFTDRINIPGLALPVR
jgi:sugar lactone lactonase YvrE